MRKWTIRISDGYDTYEYEAVPRNSWASIHDVYTAARIVLSADERTSKFISDEKAKEDTN